MIKIRSIGITKGETTLTIEYTNDLADSKKILTAEIKKADIDDKLKILKDVTGQNPTEQDHKNVICKIIDDARKNYVRLNNVFDYSKMVNVNIESEPSNPVKEPTDEATELKAEVKPDSS